MVHDLGDSFVLTVADEVTGTYLSERSVEARDHTWERLERKLTEQIKKSITSTHNFRMVKGLRGNVLLGTTRTEAGELLIRTVRGGVLNVTLEEAVACKQVLTEFVTGDAPAPV